MTKYLILLRGINVGGNNIIKMADLKACLEKSGFENVKTYIQSGNVIVESEETDTEKLTAKLEKLFSKEFNYESKIVLRSFKQIKKIIENAPKWWGTDDKYKHNLLFIKEPMTAKEALKETGGAKEGIEFSEAGDGVIYLSASIEAITRTNFVKLAGKPIYKQMTVRNYNTSVRLYEMMRG